ncbi:MAG: VWA domain-containing protein, partial [Pirellulales bacterium]
MSFAVNSPWYLLLLAMLPLVWWIGRKSLSGLTRPRAIVAHTLRTVVVVLLVLAAAEVQLRRVSDSISVVYLLDQSQSIPAAEREAMFRYVAAAVAAHRDGTRGDRAGVIVFGRQAAVEAAPVEDDLNWLRKSESIAPGMTEATNLAEALRLAQSILPSETARRVVIVSDGNENLGAAERIAPHFATQGIGIDVVPIPLTWSGDVAVEKVELPAFSQQGETIEARVVVNNDATPSEGEGGKKRVKGRLRVTRRIGGAVETLAEETIELPPGKSVFPLAHLLDVPPGFYTYDAEFIPDDDAVEQTLRNNRATSFANVRGKGRVLFIENADSPGEFDYLIERLRAADILADVRTTAQPFATLADLQSYDTVVLANVPRISGDQADVLFSDEQVEALVRNTEMGCGLVLLGGPDSFGAGGWANTRLEEVSPIDFQVKNAKVVPSGALALVVDKSSSMSGDKIAMCRRAAIEAVRVLSAKDHVGVVAFDGQASWVMPMQQIGNRRDAIYSRISRLDASGGTNMYPGMEQGYRALTRVDGAAIKHMIVLTDGQTMPASFDRLVRQMRQDNITVSTVAVGSDADRRLLADIARIGGGKYYQVTSPRAVPRIFIKEAMRVARPLVFERESGIAPQIVFPHEMVRGIEGPLPPIKGFVLSDVKDSPLVEVALRSPLPTNQQTSTVLASWTYGLGRCVAFTTDAGHRWAAAWKEWDQYDALFTQIVRWSMRPRDEEGDFLVATEYQDGKIRAVVTAIHSQDEAASFPRVRASVTTPDMQMTEMPMRQTAPGRFVGELEVDDPGNYFLSINPGRSGGVLRAGVSVPYSVEFKDKQTNWRLLEALARQAPAGGGPGVLMEGDLLSLEPDGLLQFNSFRPTLPPAISLRDVWPELALLAACMFFFDVLIRRVAIRPLAAVSVVLARLRGTPESSPAASMERLQSRKAETVRQHEQRRASVRFEPTAADASSAPLDELPESDPSRAPAARSIAEEAPAEPPSYTSRLLAAKRR